jgi:hypothetical protein
VCVCCVLGGVEKCFVMLNMLLCCVVGGSEQLCLVVKHALCVLGGICTRQRKFDVLGVG